jgi:hypothetical protein
VQCTDVRMIERSDRPCLILKAFGKLSLRNFDSNNAVQASVLPLVHFSHPAGTNRYQNLIGSQSSAASQRHIASNDSTLQRGVLHGGWSNDGQRCRQLAERDFNARGVTQPSATFPLGRHDQGAARLSI